MPIILGGKCFVIDEETQTSQNALALSGSTRSKRRLVFILPFLKTGSVLFKEGKTV